MGTPGKFVETDGNNNLWYGTPGDDAFSGSFIAEFYYSGLGDDLIYAGGGDDTISADLGNDWFDGGTGIDRISFHFVNDRGVFAEPAAFGVTVDLAKHRQDLGYFGIKTLYNIENVTGTDQADKVYGDAEANELDGGYGNDLLEGRSGSDVLVGNFGDDILVGGDGYDRLVGGADSDKLYSGLGKDVLSGYAENSLADDGSSDKYDYNSIKHSGTTAATRDTIWGTFDGANGDKIDLSGIDANGSQAGDGKFTFIGSNGFHANSTSEVQVKATANADEYLVLVDIDSDTASEMQIFVHSTTLLTASDFLL